MKKKKILKYISVLAILISPIIVYAADEYTTDEYIVCGNNRKFPTIIGQLVSTIYVIIRIIVPILLVITGIISFMKATFSSKVEESIDKAKKSLVKNIISAAIIFFIVSILNFVIRLVAGTNNSFTSCINCMIHPNECKTTKSDVAQLCPGLLSEQKYYNENCEYIGPDKEKKDYSTGETGIADTPAASTGSTIGHTLRDNPDSLNNQNIVLKNYGSYNYYLYVPKQVDESKALIIYLHGNGQQADKQKNKNRGIKATLEEDRSFLYQINHGMEFNCYILMPQAPTLSWNSSNLRDLIDHEVELNGIDKNRIHIIGFSWGANVTPTVVKNNPNYFASATMASINKGSSFSAETFSKIPTLFVTGDIDRYGKNGNGGHGAGSPIFYERINNKYGNSCYREYQNQGHGGLVGKLLNDKQLNCGKYNTYIDWVLDQKRTD